MDAPEQDITNSSALQLYHSAYRFHYEANDLKEACRMYREIIRNFPDSSECAYAVVQLEKIGAQEALKALQGGSPNKILPIAALLFSLIALFIAGTALLLVLDKKENSWYNMRAPTYCCFSDDIQATSIKQYVQSNIG
jgi:hypothetical protein